MKRESRWKLAAGFVIAVVVVGGIRVGMWLRVL